MTNEEMYAEVRNECKGKCCGESCRLNKLCESIHGNFNGNHENLLKAMEILRPNDVVNHPSHYTQGGIECIDAMVAAFGKEAVANFCMCNAFKYIWRSKHKNGAEDIEKAKWYLNKHKELTTNE